jgi:hypothetical protein
MSHLKIPEVCDTGKTSSVGFAMHHLNSSRRKHAYGSRLGKPWTIGTNCSYLRWMLEQHVDVAPQWRVCAMDGRSRWPPSHSPVAKKIPSGPGVGGEATAIVVVLPSLESRSAVGHLPEHLTGLVERDLSWQSRTRGVGVPTEVQDLAFLLVISTSPESHMTQKIWNWDRVKIKSNWIVRWTMQSWHKHQSDPYEW